MTAVPAFPGMAIGEEGTNEIRMGYEQLRSLFPGVTFPTGSGSGQPMAGPPGQQGGPNQSQHGQLPQPSGIGSGGGVRVGVGVTGAPQGPVGVTSTA